MVGITDLRPKRGELLQRHLLRAVAHPREVSDALGIGRAQVLDQVLYLPLRSRREILLDVELPEGFAEIGAESGDGALPTLLHLLLAAQGAAVEIELLLIERFGQDVRGADQIVILEVGAPTLDRNLPEQLRQTLDGVELPDHELVLRIESGRPQVGAPGDCRRQLLELRAAAQVIGQVALAPFGHGPVQGRNPRLDVQNRFCLGGGVMISRQRQHPLDMRLILLPQPLEDSLVLQIVVAVRKSEAALGERDDITIRVLRVRDDPDPDGGCQIQILATHQTRQVFIRARCGNRAQSRLGWPETRAFDGRGIDKAAIEVAHLLLIGTRGSCPREILDDLAKVRGGPLIEDTKTSPGGPIRRNRGGIEPMAVGVPVEIVARLDARVSRAQIDAEIA